MELARGEQALVSLRRIERPTPNENKKDMPAIHQLSLFLSSRFDPRNKNLNKYSSSFSSKP